MTAPHADAKSWSQAALLALTSLRVPQDRLDALNRFARYQFAVAGDYLEWSLAQCKVTLDAKNPADFLAKQAELGIKFSDRLRTRILELTKSAPEQPATSGPPHQNIVAAVTAMPVAKAPDPVAVVAAAPMVPVVRASAEPVNAPTPALTAARLALEIASPAVQKVMPTTSRPALPVSTLVSSAQAIAVKLALSVPQAPSADPKAGHNAPQWGPRSLDPSATAQRSPVPPSTVTAPAPTVTAPAPAPKVSTASLTAALEPAIRNVGRTPEGGQRARGVPIVTGPVTSNPVTSQGRSTASGRTKLDSGKSKNRRKT